MPALILAARQASTNGENFFDRVNKKSYELYVLSQFSRQATTFSSD